MKTSESTSRSRRASHVFRGGKPLAGAPRGRSSHVLSSVAMLGSRTPRHAPRVVPAAAAAVLALSLYTAPAHAQGLRLTRPAAWTPDSVVKAVITGGSAQLMPDPEVDASVPRIWLTRAERTRWKQTADYDEVHWCVAQVDWSLARN